MTNYRRYRVKGGTYFFTVNLLEMKARKSEAVGVPTKKWPYGG